MNKKELADFVDRMSDRLDEISAGGFVTTTDGSKVPKSVLKIVPTVEELSLLRMGMIAALIEVHKLLTGEEEAEDPERLAVQMLYDCSNLLFEHRLAKVKSKKAKKG